MANRLKLYELKEQPYENTTIGSHKYLTEEEDSQEKYEEIDNISIKQAKTGNKNEYTAFGESATESSNTTAVRVQALVPETNDTILPQRVSVVKKWKVLSIIAFFVIIALTAALVTVLILMLSSKVTPCTSDPCLNEGQCIVWNNSYICICTEGYYGRKCQDDPCTRFPCFNNGTCLPLVDRHNCSCDTEYYGHRCENKEPFVQAVQSPGFPSDYTNNFRKVWTIDVGCGYFAVLRFNNFSTETTHDNVYVYDGNSTRSKQLRKFSGSIIPADVRTTGQHLTMVFTTDQSETTTGFAADIYKIKK